MTSPSEQPIDRQLEFSWKELHLRSEICLPPPDRIAYPSSSEHCIIVHVANSDNLERQLDAKKWQCSPSHPGGLTFVPAHQKVGWFWDREVELFEIHLSPLLLERVARESGEIDSGSIELRDRFTIRDPFLEQLAMALRAEIQRGNAVNHLYLESLQNVLAVHLLRHHCAIEISNLSAPKKLTQSQLKQILNYIQDNLGNEIELAELAKVVRISPHHFGKLFKQNMGIPPYRYVLQCRIDRAKKLLAKKRLSIAAIATQSGFYDQSHFTNVFRRYTALTPRQYQKNF
ncbi:MAG: AraC family transcriptional regulator [Pleurocapsa sp. MO_192.B19]|nr:AraC family transcriptional regulator [Pleurocapsa sp. MO_192.B19]